MTSFRFERNLWMKTACIICEYNPFHNGHKYQIDEIKKEYDAVVCIMNGHFMQRGDIAIFDKWTRAKAALMCGADLVVELPVCFGLNSAQRFSYGGVALAEKMGVIDALCFGSECGDIEKIKNASELIYNEPDEISAKIKENLVCGDSFPLARQKAFGSLIDESLLSEPNNILAVEYVRALKEMESSILPVTIKRYKSDYHETKAKSEITSATAVRKMIYNAEDVRMYIPKTASDAFLEKKASNINKLNNILLYLLRTKTAEELSFINDVSEGLENRLKLSISQCNGFDEICEFVKTKRYTMTRIRRVLLSVILGIDKEIAKEDPKYLRVLGMNKKGADILSEVKKKSKLEIITKTADYKGFNRSFDIDILAGDIYSMCCDDLKMGLDFLNSPVVLK